MLGSWSMRTILGNLRYGAASEMTAVFRRDRHMRSIRSVRICSWLLGLGLSTPALWAQPPEAAQKQQQQPARYFVKKAQFALPLNIDPQTRNNLTGIHLFCLNNADGKWALIGKCPPTQTEFKIDTHGEGEFWFTFSLVFKDKRVVPPDPSQAEYKMGVVVDITPPTLDVQFLNDGSEGYIVQAEVRDDHLDPRRTFFEYQILNREWRALEPISAGSDRYCIPVQAAVTGKVRVSAADQAENITTREFDLPLLRKAARQIQQSVRAPEPAVVPITPPGSGPSTGNAPLTGSPNPLPKKVGLSAYPVPVAAPGMQVEDVTDKLRVLPGGVILPREKPAVSQPDPLPLQPRINDVVPLAGASAEDSNDAITKRINEPGAKTEEVHPATANSPNNTGSVITARKFSQASTYRKLINQCQVRLDYRLEQVGPSGVGKVEIWITKDQSQSWQKLGEDLERKSPVMIELPGEGLYGINIVVSNGRGFGGNPPNPGDAPDTWVEVDTTRPVVEIKDIRPGGPDDAGTLHINWNATDRNLGSEPVDLYFAGSRTGAWSVMAKGLRNDGHYRWVPPANIGSQVYVRLVARDLAGNATVLETTQAFAIDDMSRPRGRLIGIAPATPEIRVEPSGN
jgi:hypothetical protein